MKTLNELTDAYLHYCFVRKGLDPKTLRAYRADLNDFSQYIDCNHADFLEKKQIEKYIDLLHLTKAPRTTKRKIASLHAFYRYLEREELIPANPLCKLDLTFKLPQQLPRYIPYHILNAFYAELYKQETIAVTQYQLKCAARNIAVVELLFSTGIRISELCNLTVQDVNLNESEVRIHGKGNKERMIHLTEKSTIDALTKYAKLFQDKLQKDSYFFLNKMGKRLSPQSVRSMMNTLVENALIPLHITPHMFRHSFATSLVNQDVDIRCIQEILGHSSIRTTEIYTHVNLSKQKSVLQAKNPRKLLNTTTAS